MRAVVLGLWLLLAAPLHAAEGLWVEVTGYGFLAGTDPDSARRRALADALLSAALAGGAEVRGHTAVDRSVITSDLLIVRPVGRVLQHQVLGIQQSGDQVAVTIRAMVGVESGRQCDSRRHLVVAAYAPDIHVSPYAPAWAEPMATDIVAALLDALSRHPAVEHVRTTQRALPGMTPRREAVDYATLIRGSVRLEAGDHAFVPGVRLDVEGDGQAKSLVLTLDLNFVGGQGEVMQRRIERRVTLPGPTPFGRAGALVTPKRDAMVAKLTKGLAGEFGAMLDGETCKPVVALLAADKGRITAPFGSRQGLSRGSIAFTVDRNDTTELLEVVTLSRTSVELRPLDPQRTVDSFRGRPVRFVETGM